MVSICTIGVDGLNYFLYMDNQLFFITPSTASSLDGGFKRKE
jgi:hypothetical protein